MHGGVTGGRSACAAIFPNPSKKAEGCPGRARAQPQGNFRAELSVGAARVRRGAGWVPVDLTLQPKGGQVSPVAHPRDLRLSGAQPDGTHDLATVGLGGDRVALQWTGELPEPVLDGSTARYPNAIDGVDLIVRATGEGFAQSLIVRDRSAISRVKSVRLSLTGPGAARHQRDKSGVLTLLRADGGRTVTIPPLAMWDSRTDVTGTPVRKAPIRNALARTSQGLHLTLTPDRAWLRDPATVYPVTLDPTLSTIGDTYDLYVKEGVTLPDDTTNDLQAGPAQQRPEDALVPHLEQQRPAGQAGHQGLGAVLQLLVQRVHGEVLGDLADGRRERRDGLEQPAGADRHRAARPVAHAPARWLSAKPGENRRTAAPGAAHTAR